jgi:hypothetical protein
MLDDDEDQLTAPFFENLSRGLALKVDRRGVRRRYRLAFSRFVSRRRPMMSLRSGIDVTSRIRRLATLFRRRPRSASTIRALDSFDAPRRPVLRRITSARALLVAAGNDA